MKEKGQLEEWTLRTVRQLTLVLIDSVLSSRDKRRAYLPHVLFILQSGPLIEERFAETSYLVMECMKSLRRAYRFDETSKILFRAMEACGRVLGRNLLTPDCISMAAILNCLQGQMKEAEKLCTEALNKAEKGLGEKNSITILVMTDLASICQTQLKEQRAEELAERALEIAERELTPQDERLPKILSNVAETYIKQDKWEKAKEPAERSMEIVQSGLNGKHLHMSRIMSILTSIYINQEQWVKAEDIGKDTRERDGC